MTRTLKVLQLYPKDMNIYGDHGNALAIVHRAKQHGYTIELVSYDVGDTFPNDIDIIIGGGGQDSGQEKIKEDLQLIAELLKVLASGGTPMLVICGLYQLFGNFFMTKDGVTIPGIGIFDAETHGGPERLTGNIVTESKQFGEIIGYENHSGLTALHRDTAPLGKVIKGAGNNNQDGFEGAITHNVIGSYLHGSLLPKNPAITDWLLKIAAEKKFGDFTPLKIDDSLIDQAREVAASRPR